MKLFLALLAFFAFCGNAKAQDQKVFGFGLGYTMNGTFICPPEHVLSDGSCRFPPSKQTTWLRGVTLVGIVCNGPAHKAGLLVGDRIIEIAGKKIEELSVAFFQEMILGEMLKNGTELVVERSVGMISPEKISVRLVPGHHTTDLSCGKNEHLFL